MSALGLMTMLRRSFEDSPPTVQIRCDAIAFETLMCPTTLVRFATPNPTSQAQGSSHARLSMAVDVHVPQGNHIARSCLSTGVQLIDKSEVNPLVSFNIQPVQHSLLTSAARQDKTSNDIGNTSATCTPSPHGAMPFLAWLACCT